MGISITQPFKRGGAYPIDETLVLTKAEMLAIIDSTMPDAYFAICTEDGQLYLYNKDNDIDTQTGKYRPFKGGSGGEDYNPLQNKPKVNGVVLIGDKSFEDLGVETMSNLEIQAIFNKVFNKQ